MRFLGAVAGSALIAVALAATPGALAAETSASARTDHAATDFSSARDTSAGRRLRPSRTTGMAQARSPARAPAAIRFRPAVMPFGSARWTAVRAASRSSSAESAGPAIVLRTARGTATLAAPDRPEATPLRCLRLPFVFASFPPSPRSRRKSGTPAPIRLFRKPKHRLKRPPITLSFHMTFLMPWRLPARPLRGPAGSPSICSPKPPDGAVLGRRALLSEIAFARRIRVRPRLGRGLRARRRRVLSEAAGFGAVHAGDRPPAAGAAGATCRADPRRTDRRPDRARAAGTRPRRSTSPSCPSAECRLPGRQRLSAPHRPAVPLGEPRLRDLRRVPRGALGAQAQDHPPRAARGARPRHHGALADRLGPDRRGLGRVLRVLYGDRLAQMGPALSDARSSTR